MFREGVVVGADTLRLFCERHSIRKLALFGSVLRFDFQPDSDIDVLVEFEAGKTPGWEIVSIEQELSELLGRRVDLRTPEELSHYFRQAVIETAATLYERS